MGATKLPRTHLKGDSELLLTHVRLTPQVDALFNANEIAVLIFMRIEPRSLIGSRTYSLTPRAQLIGIPQPRHVQIPTL